MDFREALARHRAGDLAGAESAYRAIVAAREHPDALCNLGIILKDRGAADEAAALFRRAMAAAPDDPLPAYNLGSLLWRAGDLTGAQPLLERAAQDPRLDDARLNLGNVYLALGRDAEGWALYDQRKERLASEARKLAFPEWRGEDLSGKRLLIWPEQGLGDQIFAARFVAQLGGEVTLVCPPALERLFAQLPARVIARRGDLAVEPHDFWTLPLSLPRWTQAVDGSPYLTAPTRRTGRFGVAWKGNLLPDPRRSMPPQSAQRLLDLPGAVSLHPEDSGARDFQDTAEIVAGLDTVISIDTSVAHLAGALGKPTLVLLPHRSVDWRWRAARPWYASVSTARQAAPGDWTAPLDEAMRFLEREPGLSVV